MKTIGKISFYVVLVGLAVLALYGVYAYVLPRWQGSFFYAYCGIGLIPVGLGMLALVRDIRTRSLPEKVASGVDSNANAIAITNALKPSRIYVRRFRTKAWMVSGIS
jgi:hypothetical protein